MTDKTNNVSESFRNADDKSENGNFKKFAKELAVLSKKYGVVVKSVGGVQFGDVDQVVYSDDNTSGDLLPTRIKWANKISENDEWLTAEELEILCPKCADKMRVNKIARVKLAVVAEIIKKQVKNAGVKIESVK